jgi:hypothetical protein
MVRISKKAERRGNYPRKRRPPSTNKTGPVKDKLPKGFKEHQNAITDETLSQVAFIPKIK